MAKFDKFKHQDDAGQTPWEQYQKQYQKEAKITKKNNRFNKFSGLKKLHLNFNRNLAKFISVMTGLLLLLLFLIYLVSPLSRIASKSISGNNKLNADTLQATIPLKTGNSIIHTFNHRGQIVADFLKKNPQLKSAQLKIHGWNHVTLNVKEYGTAGYLYLKNRYYIVVDNGEIINKYTITPNMDEPIFVNFKPNNNLKSITIQYHKLSKSIQKNIVKITKAPTSYDPQRIKVEMHDKNIVYAKSTNFASKMSYYPSIVSKIKKASVINLEVGAYSYPIKNKK
ncbi:cell division protein FtsQ/DivIB [Nicoliella lavandulae]|uniref:Cell division protein DivIB n=1 Tax=Nicoliella lavandulae TaxID=3082954 RepID=A0ABU8SNG6_9LACO